MSAPACARFLAVLFALSSCTEKVDEPPTSSGAGSGGASAGGGGTAPSPTGGSSGSASGGASAGAAGTGGVPGAGGTVSSSGGASAGGSGGAGGSTGGSGGSAGGAGSTDSATIVPDPSWTCGMADGVPPPTQGELVFTATVELGETHEFGATPYGERVLRDVSGASFTGNDVEGTFLEGGLELELTLSNGAKELEGINILRTDDNVLIYVRSCGFAPASDAGGRVVLDFEVATSSSYAWLNEGKYAATRVVNEAAGTLDLAVYEISGVAPGTPQISLEDPPNVPNQPWDCSTQTGTKGASVFTETVTLGSSLSVGASKRGTRNIIPITGGTVSGSFTGTVVPGGADYQLIGGTTTLDARYTLKSNDGEYVLVRNCGPFGALIPLFEAREGGSLAFLNENKFLSSDPGSASGGVSITFYERQ